MATCAGLVAANCARGGHGGDSTNRSEVERLKAEAEEDRREEEEWEEEKRKMNPVLRLLAELLDIVNSTTVQTLMYIVFVFVFQMLTETVRNPKLEFYFDKMVSDTFIENHFDSSHNTLESIRRTADIWEWGNNVLWPGFFANLGPCNANGDVGSKGWGANSGKGCNDDVWPDGDGSFHMTDATAYTVPELVHRMDQLDWTDGLIIKQGRVQATPSTQCETKQLSGVCYPELQAYGPLVTGGARESKTSFGFNWTHPEEELSQPWVWLSDEYLGASKEGQMSAALPSMRLMPTGGFVSTIIPFFSVDWLDEERGKCDPAAGHVTWYRDHYVNTTTENKRAAFYCVRLSWNGVDCHQVCDPTHIGKEEQFLTLKGRNTGVVRDAVELFWNDMKRAHYIDAHTRVVTIQMQLRSNHIGVRYRVTLMFEMTSLGAVLPSYDMETRVEDTGRLTTMKLFMNIAMGLCMFFVLLEGIEICKSGITEYFSDMWNIMDWLNFTIFFLVWNTLRQVLAYDVSRQEDCAELCWTAGFRDDWRVMSTARTAKIYLSLCVCIQLLKIIKFTNVLIPKMSLMTAVLSKGLADLTFFGIVFIISMMAFCMMFYVQLGSVMEDFNDQPASFISLARALFGDFDIDDIMNNSSGYLNAVLFLVYLFVAVFILLSMFLAILGEAQAAVRGDQEEEEEAGVAPPPYGVLTILAGQLKWIKSKVIAKVKGKAPEEAPTKTKPGSIEEEGDGDNAEVLKLKHELEAKLGGIRDEVRGLAYQVKTLASADDTAVAKPAAVELGGFDDARALRKVVEALEQRMTRKLTQIDERLARGARGAKSGQRSSHPAAAAAAGESGGAGAEHHHRRRSSSSKNLVAATTPASAQGAVSAIAPEDEAMAC